MSFLFTLDLYGPHHLIIRLPEGYIPETIYKAVSEFGYSFKERTWCNNEYGKGFKVPLNEETLTHIKACYKAGVDYEITEQAKLAVSYVKITHVLNAKAAEKRWNYIFDDSDTDFTFPYKLKPMMHQRVAVESMIDTEFFALLMEMGTGKSKCVVDELNIYASRMQGGEIFKVVLIVPKALRINWEREIHKNMPDIFNYKTLILDGLNVGEFGALATSTVPMQIVIMSYDMVAPLIEFIAIWRPDYMALDESHYFKSPTSKRFKALRPLSRIVPRRRILTGTPVPNNILDLWTQFEVLNPGTLGFHTFAAYKKEFCELKRMIVEQHGYDIPIDQVTGFKELEKLKERMASCSLVVKKDRCLDLPDKSYEVRDIEMPKEMRAVYEQMESDFLVMVDGVEVGAEVVIAQMLKLRQFCSGFAVGYDNNLDLDEMEDGTRNPLARKVIPIPGGGEKLKVMLEDCEDVVQNSKLIIWASFHYDIEAISAGLTKMGIRNVKFYGLTHDRDRQNVIDAFNNDPEVRVFVANPKAGGVGLTLLGEQNSEVNSCRYTFYYGNSYSLGDREQSEDRNHRIGQKFKVLYRDYAYVNTIEYKIATALQGKKDVSEYMKDVKALKELIRGKQNAA